MIEESFQKGYELRADITKLTEAIKALEETKAKPYKIGMVLAGSVSLPLWEESMDTRYLSLLGKDESLKVVDLVLNFMKSKKAQKKEEFADL